MTGPDHYHEAERLISLAEGCDWQDRQHGQHELAEVSLAAAQVHATLAQVAASMDLVGATVNGNVAAGWAEVLA